MLIIEIIIMLFNLKIQKPQNNEFIQRKNMSDEVFLWFIEALKTHQSYNLVYLHQNQAKVQQKRNALSPNQNKTLLSLQKKHNFVQIVCFGEVIKNQGKTLDKNMLEGLQKLNSQQHYHLLPIKSFYNSQHKLMYAQSNIYQEMVMNVTKQELCEKFLTVVKELFKIVNQFSDRLIEKEKQRQAKIAYQINKLKEIFQENRMRRPKSTKICLLARGMDKNISKIVMNYLSEVKRNTPYARQLYAKYRQKSSKFDKQENDNMKKLSELVETRITKQNYPNKQQQKFFRSALVKPIVLENQLLIENIEEGGFGIVQKNKCTFNQLLTCCVQSQKLIEDYWLKNNIKVQKKQRTEILAKKIPKNSVYGLSSFEIQIACLNYLRNQLCQQIAQYYSPINLLDSEKSSQQQFIETKSLYSKYYQLGLSDFKGNDTEVRVRIVQEILEGIRFLVKFNVLHRDLKPSNIRMTQKGRVKIIDFGSACLNYSQQKTNPTFCYSPMYTLEYAKAHLNHISQNEYTSHQFYDLFAFGKIVQQFFSQNQGDTEFLTQNMKYLYQKCMEFNPQDRLNPIQGLALLQTLSKIFPRGYPK